MTEDCNHTKVNKRQLGARKEDMAVKFLEDSGYQIIEKNFYSKIGEIDIIARDGNYFCFIEVKYRSQKRYGYPQEAVTPAKQNKIIRTALYYMMKKHLPENTAFRFDVVVILADDITVIKNAFGAG